MSKKKVKSILEKRTAEIILTVVLIGLIAATTQASEVSNILDAGSSSDLVAEYRFDTGAGDTAYDTAGNNDGTVNGASWTSGIERKALSFDGSDDTVDLSGQNLKLEPGSTLSLWVKSKDLGSPDHEISPGIFSVNSAGGSWDNYVSFRDRGSGEATLRYEDNTGSARESELFDFRTNEWMHVAIVMDSNGKPYFYIDGKSKGSDSSSSYIDLDHIGKGYDGATDGGAFNGKMDGLRVYSKSLNKSQVRSLYNSGSWKVGSTKEEVDPSKVLDISFQHQNSSHIFDTSGYSNHGESQNGASQEGAVNCKVGRCYGFDGSDQNVNAGQTLPDMSSGGVTMMLWVKTSSSGYSRIINEWDGSGGASWVGMANGDTTNNGEFTLEWRDTSGNFHRHATGRFIDDGQWHHLAMTLDIDSTEIQGYVDGARIFNTSNSDLSNGFSFASDSSKLTIASEADSSDYFDGEIDQVKVFNRSLSQQEIIEETESLSSDGAVLDMRFDEGGGDHVEDYSGNENHGTLQPNASAGPKWKKGLTGNALKFDGNDEEAVFVSDDFSLKPEDSLSVGGWIRMNDTQPRGYSVAMHKGQYRSIYGYLIGASDSGFINFAIGNGTESADVKADMQPHKFAHIFGVYDSKNSEIRIYKNGELANTQKVTFSPTYKGEKFALGRRADWGTRYFSGTLDEVKVYPYVVSNSKIKGLYSRGKSHIGSSSSTSSSSTNLQDGLVLSQTFNRVENCGQSNTISCPSGMSGEIAVDESGEANHGDVENGFEIENLDCVVGRCGRFSEDGTTVNIHDHESLQIKDNITVSFWIKPESWTDSYSLNPIEKHDGTGDSMFRVYLDGDWSTDKEMAFYATSGDTWDRVSPHSEPLELDKWQHITWTYSDGGQLYLNGKPQGSVQSSGKLNISEGQDIQIGNFDGLIDQVKIYNRSLPANDVWKLYTKGRDRSSSGEIAGPVAQYPIQQESSPLRDVSGENNHGDLNLLGETGTFNTSDGEWKKIRFERSYQNPVVVGTTNTHNGESALSFQARNVKNGYAEMRLCESEGGSGAGCDMHGTEETGYMVIDAASTDSIPGIEAGSFSIDSDFDSKTNTVSYSEGFTNDPYVMANVQTSKGKQPVEARVKSYSNTSFVAGICHQDSTDGCDSSHNEEEVGWIALEPGNLPFKETSDVGSTGNSVSGSTWTEQSFSSSFSEKPVVVASTVSNDGGQDNLIDEARNLNTTRLEVRYCELETGNNCDGHTSEEVVWVAAEKGLLTYSNGNFPRYVDTERGKALKFDGGDDSVSIPASTKFPSGSDPFTVSTYVKIPESCSTGSGIFGYGNWGTGDQTNALRTTNSCSGIYHYFWGNDGSTGDIGINDGRWHHVAVTYDGSSRSIFIDGVQEASDTPGSVDMQVQDVNIGVTNSNEYFNGYIDDVRIYPYALSQEQVKQVKNSGATAVG